MGSEKGFSVIEVLLATALFAIVSTGVIGVVLEGLDANRLGQEAAVATEYADEGIEATQSIANQNFANLVDTSAAGIASSSGTWAFSGTNNVFLNKYTRVLAVSDVYRDTNGNIVTTGGTLDPLSKKITATVTWHFTPTRSNTVSLSTYISNWRASYIQSGSGMLVYGNGGTTNDQMMYQILSSSNAWSTPAPTADVDPSSGNRAARIIRVYASATRNEKILVSRHFDGTSQYLYAQVYNGTSWGNVHLLSSWTGNTFLDVQNFDGSYGVNGNFIIVFSDNTIIPKMITWNGSSWSAISSLTTLGGGNIPNYIVAKSRPGTNEVMAAFFTQGSSAITQYYSGTTWSAITIHSTSAPTNTQRLIDFDWSPNNSLIGEVIYSVDGASDRKLHSKIWTANGIGGGTWSTEATTDKQLPGTTRLGAMTIKGIPGVNQFEACNDNSDLSIICYTSDFTPTWSNPINQTLSTTTQGGIQRTFDLGFEQQSGNPGINVFSDNTTTPQLKKYSVSTTSWDSANTSLPNLAGIVDSVRLIPNPKTNDVLILLGDTNLDLTSMLWNGTNNIVATASAIGDASVETGADSDAVGQAEAFQTTATSTQSINTISLYLSSSSLSTAMTVGLYTNTLGHPGTLLGQGSLSSLTNGAWNSFPLPATNIVSGTTYWITLLGTGGGVPKFFDRASGPCHSETSQQTNLTSLPATWTTGTIFSTCPLSAFAPLNGSSLTGHGAHGSATTDYWYDFAWDQH